MPEHIVDAVYAGKLDFDRGPMDPFPKWWGEDPISQPAPDYKHLPYCNFWTKPIGSPGCMCMVIDKNERIVATDGSSAKSNIEYLLNRCKYTIRMCEGGGPESLLDSLIVTFMKMEHRLKELDK